MPEDKLDQAARKIEGKKPFPIHVHGWETLSEIAFLIRQTPGRFKHFQERKEEKDARNNPSDPA